MTRVVALPLPADALLNAYLQNGSYTDCFTTVLKGRHKQSDFVFAFYTTWLFKLERFLLRWLVSKPSTDSEAAQLASGTADAFAAWTVEKRSENQLLMCDYQARTRSWLKVDPELNGSTRLYFGSAVTKSIHARTGRREMGKGFALLLGFHKLYSRALLAAARRRLQKLVRDAAT